MRGPLVLGAPAIVTALHIRNKAILKNTLYNRVTIQRVGLKLHPFPRAVCKDTCY